MATLKLGIVSLFASRDSYDTRIGIAIENELGTNHMLVGSCLHRSYQDDKPYFCPNLRITTNAFSYDRFSANYDPFVSDDRKELWGGVKRLFSRTVLKRIRRWKYNCKKAVFGSDVIIDSRFCGQPSEEYIDQRIEYVEKEYHAKLTREEILEEYNNYPDMCEACQSMGNPEEFFEVTLESGKIETICPRCAKLPEFDILEGIEAMQEYYNMLDEHDQREYERASEY